MTNKTEEQLKLLNEILSIVTFNRHEDGALYISEAKGYVALVNGNVGIVEGDVFRVGGDVDRVRGEVTYLHGKVENYVEQN